MSKKRSREISTVDAQNVEIFEDLAHEREKVRLQAAHRLLSNLAIDNSPSAEQLEKTLKRLFRGLCSGRKAARLGFSVALTEFLKINANQDPDASEDNALSLRGIIKVWRELSKSSGNISGWVIWLLNLEFASCC